MTTTFHFVTIVLVPVLVHRSVTLWQTEGEVGKEYLGNLLLARAINIGTYSNSKICYLLCEGNCAGSQPVALLKPMLGVPSGVDLRAIPSSPTLCLLSQVEACHHYHHRCFRAQPRLPGNRSPLTYASNSCLRGHVLDIIPRKPSQVTIQETPRTQEAVYHRLLNPIHPPAV